MNSKKIGYGRQNITEEDIDAVAEVLRSDYLTQGPTIHEFEKRFANYVGAKYAAAVSSATAALHLTCLAFDLKPKQRLWTSPNTFVASSNCALYCGADVDFVDIDPQTYNLSVLKLKEKLEQAKKENTLPHIVVPVHHSGASCDMKRIHELSKQYGFKVLEDASHAVGAFYETTRVGSCQFSDAAVFSFHPVKIMTTGEGGIVATNDQKLYERILQLRTHGITRDQALMTKISDGPWYYQQISLGFHYRMTDIQAALGLSQLKRVESFLGLRRQIAKKYDEALRSLPLQLPIRSESSSWHLYAVRLQLDKIKKSQKQIFEELHARDIMVNLHYIPVHLQPYYQKQGFRLGMFPEAEKYYGEAMTLPIYPDLTDQDQLRVVAALKEVLI